MSNLQSLKIWKTKKSADFSQIPLKKMDTLMVDIPPTKTGWVPVAEKPVIRFDDFRPHGTAPLHEIAKLMEKACLRSQRTYGERGMYFIEHSDGGISAGCVMGAVILEMEDGERIARGIISEYMNRTSWGVLARHGLVPAQYRDRSVIMAIHRAQTMNDTGLLPMQSIARQFAREVGYHAPKAKVAA